MSKEIGTIRDLKEGKYVIIEDAVCKVTKMTKSKPGKHGSMKARIEAQGVFDGQKRNMMGPVDQKIEIPMINKETAQVVSVVGDTAQLMSMSTYETFEIDLPDDFKDVSPGDEVMYMEALGNRKLIRQ